MLPQAHRPPMMVPLAVMATKGTVVHKTVVIGVLKNNTSKSGR